MLLLLVMKTLLTLVLAGVNRKKVLADREVQLLPTAARDYYYLFTRIVNRRFEPISALRTNNSPLTNLCTL